MSTETEPIETTGTDVSSPADADSTIVIAIVASVGGLLLIGSIAACAFFAHKRKEERARREAPTTLAVWQASSAIGVSTADAEHESMQSTRSERDDAN